MKRCLKWAALLLALLTMVTLVACSGGGESEETKADKTESVEETEASKTEAVQTEVAKTEGFTETIVAETEIFETGESNIELGVTEFETLESDTETHESEPPHEHNWREWTKEKDATCTEKGREERTCSCGESETREIVAEGHVEVIDVAVAPNCIEAGLTEGTHCAVCYKVLIPQIKLDELGHTKVIDAEVDAPTCSQPGLTEKAHCSVCDIILAEQEIIPALDHNFIDGRCEHCYIEPSEGLTYISNGDGTCSISGIGTCTDNNVVISNISPDGDVVTGIGNSAFSGCSNLTSIDIPYGVTFIGSDAFYNCDGLSNIKIPDSVMSIWNNTFYDCDNLIQTENDIYYVDRWVIFRNGYGGENVVTLRENTVGIANFAFAGHGGANLTRIKIPDSVRVIGSDAFQCCDTLTHVEFGKNSQLVWIENRAFIGCSNLTNIEIPDHVTRIDFSAFSGCDKLIKIVNGVSYVDKWVVACDENMKNVTLSANTRGIAGSAFRSCSNLKSIEIPDSVTSIGASAFYYCGSLKNIEIPDSVMSIGASAFSSCASLKNIEIPSSVTSIGKEMFLGCQSLESITFIGTKAEWQTLEKGFRWNDGTGTYTVHCTDGDLSKSES